MMYIETLGQGRELVLLHGWGMHGGVWRDLAMRLSSSFRVIVPDLSGHGRSRGQKHGLTLDDMAQELFRHVTGPATWIGWSLGAFVALTVARRFPAAVARFVLVGATPRFVQGPDWPHAMSAATLAGFAAELERDHRGTLLRFLSLQLGDGDTARESLRTLRTLLLERGAPEVAALRAGLTLLEQTDLRAQLPGISAPALVLHGGRDRLVPPAAGEYLARRLVTATFARIPAAGHAPFLSHPHETWQELEPFVHA